MSSAVSGIKTYVQQVQEDDLFGLAAELAYRFLFAIFPFVIFLAALAAFVAGALGMSDPTQQIMSGLGDNLPSNLVGPVQDQLTTVIAGAKPELLSFGAVAALYAAAGGTNALMKAMNRAYDLKETRPFYVRIALAVGLTVLAGAGLVLSFVTIVGGALVTEQIAQRTGVGGAAWTAISLLRWPLVFAVLVVAAAILFRYGPNVRTPWRWSLLGGAVFAVGWLVVTFVFALYVSRFGRFDVTYGALGGVIVLMLWFYLTAAVLVGAAELVALVVQSRETELVHSRRAQTSVTQAAKEAAGRAEREADRAAEGVREAANEATGRTREAGAGAAGAGGSSADGDEGAAAAS